MYAFNTNTWISALRELENDQQRKSEIQNRQIPCQKNQSLRYYEKTYGQQSGSGFALFICLHGGGQGSAEMNDSQWKDIIPFLERGFQNGTIAVAPRGITNTWNLHFVDETFPAMIRLIENFIIFKNVDPNRVYLIGFSAGGDGAYSLCERIPFMLAAASPQGGHPNGVSTLNISNLPVYLAVGEKDGAYKRNTVAVEYYKQIVAQKGKFCGNFEAKVEVVGGSPHSFQCWKTPRKSFFNGANNITTSNETAFTFMYSHQRNPYPTELTIDVKTWLTPLRNYYTERGNTFYNVEVGKNPPEKIQLKIDYNNNNVVIKEGSNFKLNLNSKCFRGGNIINVTELNQKPYQVRLQCDENYSKRNMKLYCDPNYGFDSYIIIGKFDAETKQDGIPQPAQKVDPNAQQNQPQQNQQNYPQQNQNQQYYPPNQQYYPPQNQQYYPQQNQPYYPQQQNSNFGYPQYPNQQMGYGGYPPHGYPGYGQNTGFGGHGGPGYGYGYGGPQYGGGYGY